MQNAVMFTLPNLPYQFNELEPHIDAKTMEIHHTKHHQAYINNLNTALEKHPDLVNWSLEDLFHKIDSVPSDISTVVINNAGGHQNHSFFWQIMTPKSSKIPHGNLAKAIDETFGSFQLLVEKFNQTAMSRFGSGWTWMTKNPAGKLEVYSTANQESPLMENQKPILALDIWEHAYYLNYQNRRADYIVAWWNLVNWDFAETQFAV